MGDAAGGPWECAACGEMNRADRAKCNNCGKAKPCEEDGKAAATATSPQGGAEGDAARATAAPEVGRPERKRRRGWNDEEEQERMKAAKVAASVSAATME